VAVAATANVASPLPTVVHASKTVMIPKTPAINGQRTANLFLVFIALAPKRLSLKDLSPLFHHSTSILIDDSTLWVTIFGCPGLGGMASSGRNSLPRGALAPFAKRLKNSCEFAKPVLTAR
jgi:hypothetical protein